MSAKQCHREYCKRAQTSERLALLNKVQAEAASNAAAGAGTANAEPLNEVLDNVQRHAGARLSRQGTVSVVKMVATAISGISSGITAASGAATLSVVGAPVGVVLSFVAMGVSGLGAAVSAGMGAYAFFSDRSATQQKEAIKDGPALQATLDAIKQEYQVKGNTTATITDDEARAKLAETNRFFAATQFLDQLGAGGSAGEQGRQWLEKLGMPKTEIEHLVMQASADRPVTPSSAAFESACKFLFG
ncbi:hypothetical protein SDC9_132061 [bioreactor metagenome]|uniref:Uncharacterized protein n=1 Tax=bioreactor metagenome TaxID=1076179 RepID=A0A645D6M3_9ZZZZ